MWITKSTSSAASGTPHATAAELTDFQRQVLWGRQFLNPYALYDYTIHPNLAPTRRSLAPTRPDIDLEV